MPTVTNEAILDVWGSGANNVFAVGTRGEILRFNGTTWSTMTSGTSTNLFGVWGAASDDVYAVGANGVILHFDGTAWRSMSSGTSQALLGIGGTIGTAFAVGNAGTIVRGRPATSDPAASFGRIADTVR